MEKREWSVFELFILYNVVRVAEAIGKLAFYYFARR